LREKFEEFTEPSVPRERLVNAFLKMERRLIELLNVENEAGPLDQKFGNSRFEREFNGMTLDKGEIVLTFDDGPSRKYTPIVHETIKKLGIPAGFFEIGECVDDAPQLTQGLAADGYVIANHSWSHPDMVKLDNGQIAEQINRTQNLIQATLGGPDFFDNYYQGLFQKYFEFPRRIYHPEFFRFPYGSRNERTVNVAVSTVVGSSEKDGQQQLDTLYSVMWNVDSLDWKDHSPAGIEERVFNELATYGNRGVILMHDVHPQTVEAIQTILPRLQREGYKFLTLYEMVVEAQKKQADFLTKP